MKQGTVSEYFHSAIQQGGYKALIWGHEHHLKLINVADVATVSGPCQRFVFLTCIECNKELHRMQYSMPSRTPWHDYMEFNGHG